MSSADFPAAEGETLPPLIVCRPIAIIALPSVAVTQPPLNIKTAFGIAVRSLRLERGLSQEKLAELSDIHRTYIGDVERGTRNIALMNMAKISDALGVKLSDLIRRMEKSGD